MTGVAAEVGSTANNYQILARLATGGMAEIFLARGVSTTGVERYCVLKRILRERANDVNFVRMFLDEARLAAQLQHPNVAQVYDIGKLGESYFFTMEYVHGETVRALLHRARSLRREVPTNAVLTIMAGAAGGLHHAHERLGHDGRPLGIVHRDVSPSNLMVSYEGGVKVVDFGVAKAENRAQETRSGTVKGKIAYLSPEACRGAPIDRRSDLFSLGIVFWEMLTTERLYKRASDFDNMTAIVNEDPVPPSSRRKSVPAALDRIALRLLEKDPDRRYQTADELVEALEDTASKLGTMISPSTLGRFLREMFGQRPEPWLELDATQEMPVEGVTVTSEPIPKELAVSVAQSVDYVLSGVRDIAARPSEDRAELVGIDAIPQPNAHASSQQMTAPAMPAQPPPNEPQEMIHRLPLAAPPPSGISHAPLRFRPPDPSVPLAHSSSGSHSFPGTGSQAEYPIVATTPLRSSRSWPLVAIVAAAAIIGSLTVWFAMRSGKTTRITTDATTGLAVTPPSDAAELVAIVELDAPAIADEPDAQVPIEPVGADAGGTVADERKVAFDEQRYADVVTACGKGSVSADHAMICTLAACHVKLEAKARVWAVRIASGAARRSTAASCRELGVELVKAVAKQPPTTKPPTDAGVVDQCVLNPMSCQR